MRKILAGAILVSVFTGCSEGENLTLQNDLRDLGDPPQIFTITNDGVDTIKSRAGVTIVIRPNSFLLNEGQDPDEEIQIELREVFDKSDMILNGLSTQSDGRLLESFGMISLRATAVNDELHLKDGASIGVSIPNKRRGNDGELFYGIQTDSSFNWEYAGAAKDTTLLKEIIRPMSDGLASVKEEKYKYVNGFAELVSDTAFVRLLSSQDSVDIDRALIFPDTYDFEVRKLGWINCDKFIPLADNVDLEIALRTYSQPIGYVVFESINSIMPVGFDRSGRSTVRNLPKDYPAELIVIDKINGEFMWSRQSLKIENTTLTLSTKPISESELKSQLKKLDE
jgi:hypothetical protein